VIEADLRLFMVLTDLILARPMEKKMRKRTRSNTILATTTTKTKGTTKLRVKSRKHLEQLYINMFEIVDK
jgi:hypothetical protein